MISAFALNVDAGCADAVCCGTGGCAMEILLTLPSGNIRSVSDRVFNYKNLPDRSPNSKVAGRERRITATPFGFKMPE